MTDGNFVLRCKRCKGTILECKCTASQMREFEFSTSNTPDWAQTGDTEEYLRATRGDY